MGVQLETTPAMGEYMVEVRRESFYLQGAGKHSIGVYPDVDDTGNGVIEILSADIPKIRAALDRVQHYLDSNK
jgi:hypothetical protein